MAIPTGSPVLVRPAGSDSPGRPAALPGVRLRMKVPKVGTVAPLSITVSSSPIFAAGSGVVGKIMAATSRSRK